MKFAHAVLWMDHQEGHLVRFNATSHEAEHIRAYDGKEKLHRRAGTLGDGKPKSHPEYFQKLSSAIDTVDAALVVGSGTAKSEFLHFLENQSATVRAKVLGTQNSERVTEPQLLALARHWFKPVDRMRG